MYKRERTRRPFFFHLVLFLRYISAVGVRYIHREFTHGVFAEVIAGRGPVRIENCFLGHRVFRGLMGRLSLLLHLTVTA